MKLIFLFLTIIFTPFSLMCQNVNEFEDLLSDTTIKKRITYHVSVDNGESKMMHITSVNKTKRTVIDKDTYGCENGCSWRLTEYNDDWKPIKKIWYVYDTVQLFVYFYYYNDLGLLKYRTEFGSEKGDGFKTLKLSSKTNFFYNSKGFEVGYVNTTFINGDTLNWKKNKGEYKLAKNGLAKTKRYYQAEKNSENYKLWREVKYKYSFFSKKYKGYVTKDLEKKTKRTTKRYYKDGQLIKGETYKDGKLEDSFESKYENGLKKEERLKNFTPGVELDFIVRYEYIR